MRGYYYNTSQFKNIQGQDLGADAMLMAEYIDEIEELKSRFNNNNNTGNLLSTDSDSSTTLREDNNLLSYNEIAQREYERQKFGIDDLNQSGNNTTSDRSFTLPFYGQASTASNLGEISNLVEKPLHERIKDWAKSNPGKTMLLAGLVATGGYFLYHSLASEKEKEITIVNNKTGKGKRKRYRKVNSENNTPELKGISQQNTTEEESSQIDSLKEAGLKLLSFFGGGIAGSTIGKQSLFVGIPLALYGLYSKNYYATCAGIGMAISSFVIDIFKNKENKTSNAQTINSVPINPQDEMQSGKQAEELNTTVQAPEEEKSPTIFITSEQPTIANWILEENSYQTSSIEGTDSKELIIDEYYFDKEF
jgi:hypothetical protein